LEKISSYLDNFSELTGKVCSWFVAIMVLVTCLVVIMRYGLDMGSVFLQDVVLYLHGGLFLLGAAFALKRGAHVRVDIFYRNFSESRKALVDLLGNLIFLQPVCWTILLYSWGYVEFSWRIMEVSPEPDGLPFVYIQKSLLIAVAILLALQSFSEILKSYLTIRYHG
jgi:TRAP-type mannitol/chloroaromatic compound transport system permease small subunit